MEFILQPNVYSTGKNDSLLMLLSKMWITEELVGNGTLYIISGFANYNGGVRFFPFFSKHIQSGGKVEVFISGSTAQRLSSIQIAEALLECGANVHIINRKRLLHAKCYGYTNSRQQELIVTSGNFTGPGMSQNAEASLFVDKESMKNFSFSWNELIDSIMQQNWNRYDLELSDIQEKKNPGWQLLYDEVSSSVKLDTSQLLTMIVKLSHSDTARIQAEPQTNASKGTQYFWLSKGTFDFFPALTTPNKRGYKHTYSTLINVNYIDLNIQKQERVTFEADNNLDFRLGTGTLRNTKIADKDDLALITRKGEYDYEIRIISKKNTAYEKLLSYAVNYIGNYGKVFGYINNEELFEIISD